MLLTAGAFTLTLRRIVHKLFAWERKATPLTKLVRIKLVLKETLACMDDLLIWLDADSI